MNKAELEAEAGKVSAEVAAYLTSHTRVAWFIYGVLTLAVVEVIWKLVH